MGAVIHFHHLLEGKLSIFLGGGEALVAQQFLNGPQVGAFAQHVSAEGMAQGMRMDVRWQPFGYCYPLHDSGNTASRQRASTTINKKPPRIFPGFC